MKLKIYKRYKYYNIYNHKSYIIFTNLKLSSSDIILLDWFGIINGIIKLAEVVRILAASWAALTLAISASPVGIIMALVGALSALGVYLAAKTDASSFEGFDLSGAMGNGGEAIMNASSTSQGTTTAAANNTVGVFVGCQYVNSMGQTVEGQFYQSNAAQTARTMLLLISRTHSHK